MISVRFQGKPFNITLIQVYAPTSNAEEAEVERFYEDLQDLLELTAKKPREKTPTGAAAIAFNTICRDGGAWWAAVYGVTQSWTKFACYSRGFLTSYFCIPVPYNENEIFFGY